MNSAFDRFAQRVALAVGSPWAFATALAVVAAWFIAGPFIGFGNTLYQLVINTGTTIVTFLVVFLIQHSQNQDTREIKALLREIAEDLPQVHDERVPQRMAEEEA